MYSISWLVFITENEFVYSAVRVESFKFISDYFLYVKSQMSQLVIEGEWSIAARELQIPYYGGSRRQYAYIGVDAITII